MMKKSLELRIRNIEWLTVHSKFYILHSIFLLLFSCSSVAQKGGSGKPYSEDLSKLRPKVDFPEEVKRKDTAKDERPTVVAATKNINAKVDIVLDSIDRFNLTRRFIDGFTIQIYSGQRKEDAMNMMKRMKEEVPELNANPIKYEQPKFRVTVGKYFTRLEAQPDLLTLRRKFNTASLVPEKIQLK